jgi:hypothetical protein
MASTNSQESMIEFSLEKFLLHFFSPLLIDLGLGVRSWASFLDVTGLCQWFRTVSLNP